MGVKKMIKTYIDKIVQNGKQEDMECLKDILSDTMYELKTYNEEDYKKYKNKIKGMAYDYQFDEELAKEIVEKMRPLGEHWDMETIASVIGNDSHGLINMYVVLNSLANDYKDVISLDDTETYVNLAHAWLDDEDGKEHKLWKYFIGD